MSDKEQINFTMKTHEKEGSVNLSVSLDYFGLLWKRECISTCIDILLCDQTYALPS